MKPETKIPFEKVVQDHGASVLRVVRAIVGPDDADDAWSETFLAALRAYPDLPPDANTEAWLVTIARHKALDVLRGRSRRAVPLGELPDTDVSDPDLVEALDLAAALETLPDKQRRCVALHHLAGLPHTEVAQIVGGSTDAARRACADGVAALRRRPLERTR